MPLGKSVRWILSAVLFMMSAGSGFTAEPAPARFKVVTSFYPVYIMALNVTKGVPGVIVENLTPPQTGCLHDYALTPDDMKKLEGARMFVYNGAGMESFLGQILAQYPQVTQLELTQNILLIKDDQGEPNPHVWVSVTNAIRQVESLGRIIAFLDKDHADLYKRNTQDYQAKLTALRDKMQGDLAGAKGKEIVTFHEAFPYFAREFELKIAAVLEREPGSQPSAQELARTIDLVKKSGIKALFSEPQYPDSAAQTIAQETGAKVYILDPAVSGPDEADAYLKIMEKNLATLKDALL